MNWTDWTGCWERKHTHTAAGYGIFARQDIHCGQPIFRVCPELEDDLYPVDVINHSCVPSMFAFESRDPHTGHREIRFYAIREIEMGEELTISYADIQILREDEVDTRSEWIYDSLGFECLCLKCIGQWLDSDWDCPDHWIIDYNLSNRDLITYLKGLIYIWRYEHEHVKLQVRDKARILAQRTVFSLRSFRDDLKSAAEEIKRNTSGSRHRLKRESKILRAYVRRRELLGNPVSGVQLYMI